MISGPMAASLPHVLCSAVSLLKSCSHIATEACCESVKPLMQEIYGITEANQAANSDGDFSAECVVCLTNRKNTTVLPCRHFCMCAECAKALLRRTRTCPMCRLPISSVLQIQIQQSAPR